MKLAGMATLLFSLLGTSWATSFRASRTLSDIKLKWLEDQEIDGTLLPHMEITFADGTTDEIFLKRDTNNPCFYHGALKSDIDSEVEVDGCKDEVEIVEISSRLIPCGLIFLLLENKVTYKIDPTEGISFNSTDTVAPTTAGFQGAHWQGPLPRTAVAKIHIRFDQTLVDMFGGDHAAAKLKAQTIVELSRVHFKRRRGLLMDIDIKVLTNKFYNIRIGYPSEQWINYLSGKGREGDEDEHPTAWITAASGRGAAGIADLPGICRGKKAGAFLHYLSIPFLSFYNP